MEHLLGLLRIRIHRGVNLVARDATSSDPYVVIRMGEQEVYDKDTFSIDDKMGNALFDIETFLEAVRMRLDNLPNGTIITTVKPTRTNCLAEESHITWTDGKPVQNMVLRLQNVECGEIEIRLSWVDIPGSRGL